MSSEAAGVDGEEGSLEQQGRPLGEKGCFCGGEDSSGKLKWAAEYVEVDLNASDMKRPGPRRALSESAVVLRKKQCSNRDIRQLRDKLLRNYTQSSSTGFLRSLSSRQLWMLFSIALIEFTSSCAMSIMAPFFPIEAASKGMSISVSGFVFASYALVMVISCPFMGKILPRVGCRFMLLMGVLVCAVCNIIFGMLDKSPPGDTFTALCFSVRIMEALGAAAFSTACFTLVADLYSDNIGAALGIMETFVGLGLSVGPAIGGALYQLGGYGLPFFFLGVAMILSMPFNWILLPSVEECGYVEESKPAGITTLLTAPPVIVVSLVVVVASNTWGFLDPTLEPHLRQFDLPVDQLGLFFLLVSAMYAIFSPIWGWLADQMIEAWPMMVAGLFGCAVSLLLIGPSPLLPFLPEAIWLNIVSLIILGISCALVLLPTFEAILDYAIASGCSDSLGTYSVVAGLWSCMYSLGEVVGPSLGGVLLDNYGFPVCSSVMAAMCIVLAVGVQLFFCWWGPLDLPESETTDSDSALMNDSCSSVLEKLSRSSSLTDERSPLLSSQNGHSGLRNPGHILSMQFKDHKPVKTVMISSSGACEV